MKPKHKLAIVGSGPSAIYLLKHLADRAEELRGHLESIEVFEKSPLTGMGMPFSPITTDRFHLSNISSEELAELPESLVDWLRKQPQSALEELGITREDIDEKAIFSRLTLGRYFRAQYLAITTTLAEGGIRFAEHLRCGVSDLEDFPENDQVELVVSDSARFRFNRVVIATGHDWPPEDVPAAGYYASPWPISKLLPSDGHFLNHTVGTLGSSLSAFDVITSLAHRHGKFGKTSGGTRFHPDPGAEGFRIVMHSADGLLPHLQYEQAEPMREIYRHVDRDTLLSVVGNDGFLKLDAYFDGICRPVLIRALDNDGLKEMAVKLEDPNFGWKDFVDEMTRRHTYEDPFDGMREELEKAYDAIRMERPTHWKETLDDLIYTLNFHAELLPAEDHSRLHSLILPFLLNIVAALPLESAEILLALHAAGKLELLSGKIVEVHKDRGAGTTFVELEDSDLEPDYRTFVDCSGQQPVEPAEYPFPSLARDQVVRPARALFANPPSASKIEEPRLFEEAGVSLYRLGGIDVDPSCHVVGDDDSSNIRIFDMAFPHTSGIRPYSYGLQSCNETAGIVADALCREIQKP